MTLARLQLAVGAAAQLIEELPPDGPRRRFAARSPTADASSPPTRLVILHPAPPDGPPASALLDRMAALMAIGHPVVAPPLATGSIESQAWVVEPMPTEESLASRLQRDGTMPAEQVIGMLREIARALVVLHRHRIAHGTIDVTSVTVHDRGATLHSLGRTVATDPSIDLRALGALGQRALGLGRPLARTRVPSELTALLAELLQERPATVWSAERVLSALDVFPGPVRSASSLMLGNVVRGARSPRERSLVLVVVAVILLAVFGWIWLRWYRYT